MVFKMDMLDKKMDMINSTTLEITPELLNLIAEIDEFKGSWKALGTLAPERLSALRRVATIESVGSSTRIEGSRLSDRDVEKLLSNIANRSVRAMSRRSSVTLIPWSRFSNHGNISH